MRGLYVSSGKLYFDGKLVSGVLGDAGIYVRPNRDLYFNNEKIASGDVNNPIGITLLNNELKFDGIKVGEQTEVPPVAPPSIIPPNNSEFSPEGFWQAPLQEAGQMSTLHPNAEGKWWKYAKYLELYDAMATKDSLLTKHRYEDETGAAIKTSVYAGEYELYHYKFEPPNYTRTVFMQASIHGDENDSRLTLYRMIDILINKRNQVGYTAWQEIYNNCRLIIIPIASPWGVDNQNAKIGYKPPNPELNGNRNYDSDHIQNTNSGYGGDTFFDVAETRHTRDTLLKYGVENFDLAIDYHDGQNVEQHYWIISPVDSAIRAPLFKFLPYMLERNGVAPEDAIVPNYLDGPVGAGTSPWLGKTMGLTGVTNEYMGGLGGPQSGYFGYDFSPQHMTHSLEIRSNILFMAMHYDLKTWLVREPVDAKYFHFDYPRAFTRHSLREDAYSLYGVVTLPKVYERWDELVAKHPTLIKKSEVLGVSALDKEIHTYTFGKGTKKVLYVGGYMRWGAEHKIDEFAIYLLVEYLCNDYIVKQSKFLRDLRDNYTIVVLPMVDTTARNYEPQLPEMGLNNGTYRNERWIIDADDKAVPVDGPTGTGNHGIKIIKKLIDDNADLKCIVSGGEITTGHNANNKTQYSTDYQTQIITPKNQVFDKTAYTEHLATERNELIDIDNTDGRTFGDYAYDQFNIPTYFVQLKVSDRFFDLAPYHKFTEEEYSHQNYEAGRRMANIANLFLV